MAYNGEDDGNDWEGSCGDRWMGQMSCGDDNEQEDDDADSTVGKRSKLSEPC